MKTCIFLAGFAWAIAAQAVTFYVDSKAAAGGDGSSAKPWNTVTAAVNGVRVARKGGMLKSAEPIEVQFFPGDYFVGDGVRLVQEDSGTDSAPVVWRTVGAARARLTGGVRVDPELFRKVEDPAILARLPEEARGKVYVADVSGLVPAKIPGMAKNFGATPTAPLLFVGRRLGTLARWPNADYTSFSKAVDKGTVVTRRPDGGTVRTPGAFIY
ncbi:MAG: hypothetical protein Q4G65_19015, partial [bacterium]|nr:hypothetical protein [bacterium]